MQMKKPLQSKTYMKLRRGYTYIKIAMNKDQVTTLINNQELAHRVYNQTKKMNCGSLTKTKSRSRSSQVKTSSEPRGFFENRNSSFVLVNLRNTNIIILISLIQQ